VGTFFHELDVAASTFAAALAAYFDQPSDEITLMHTDDKRAQSDIKQPRFEREMLPHLDAAYNLARWLLRGADDAEDVAQEAFVRALMYFDGFRGQNAKACLLRIVRNACYRRINDRMKTESMHEPAVETAADGLAAPDARLIEDAERRLVNEGLQALPADHHEILVLREIEQLSYKDIGEAVGIPIGTVMSRLSRARTLLRQRLSRDLAVE
jgi:RNA polymerase sigma-70 factor (ECF subfamily)